MVNTIEIRLILYYYDSVIAIGAYPYYLNILSSHSWRFRFIFSFGFSYYNYCALLLLQCLIFWLSKGFYLFLSLDTIYLDIYLVKLLLLLLLLLFCRDKSFERVVCVHMAWHRSGTISSSNFPYKHISTP